MSEQAHFENYIVILECVVILKTSELSPTTGDLVTSTRKKVGSVDTARVLHLINGEHFAGAERVQDLLAMALPQFGYEVQPSSAKNSMRCSQISG